MFGCYKFLAFKIPQSLQILFLFWIYQNQFFGSEVYSYWKPAEVNFLRLGSAPWVAALEIKLSKFGVSTLPIPIGRC